MMSYPTGTCAMCGNDTFDGAPICRGCGPRTQPSPVEGRQELEEVELIRGDDLVDVELVPARRPPAPPVSPQDVSQPSEPAGDFDYDSPIGKKAMRAFSVAMTEKWHNVPGGCWHGVKAALAVARADWEQKRKQIMEQDKNSLMLEFNKFRQMLGPVPLRDTPSEKWLLEKLLSASAWCKEQIEFERADFGQQLQQRLDEALAEPTDVELDKLEHTWTFDQMPSSIMYAPRDVAQKVRDAACIFLASRRARLGRKKEPSLEDKVREKLLHWTETFMSDVSRNTLAAEIIALVRAEIGGEK